MSTNDLGPIPGLKRGAFGGLADAIGGWFGGLAGGRSGGRSIASGSSAPNVAGSLHAAGSALRDWWQRKTSGPTGPRFRILLVSGAAVLMMGGGVGAFLALRPVPQPDYLTAPLDDVFSYTLLTDEFNKLPVEERLALMGKLIQRLKNMSSGDSMLLAAFASGIAGSARDQIERNVSRLAIDVWDKAAVDYTSVKDEDRVAFLEKTFVDFTKMMEVAADGQPSDKTDEERIAEVKRQADRDRARLRDPNRQPTGQELGRFFAFMNGTVGGHASPQQKARGQVMLRDMARHFRGQDINTGQPLPPGPK